jgi:hypothetical protein
MNDYFKRASTVYRSLVCEELTVEVDIEDKTVAVSAPEAIDLDAAHDLIAMLKQALEDCLTPVEGATP